MKKMLRAVDLDADELATLAGVRIERPGLYGATFLCGIAERVGRGSLSPGFSRLPSAERTGVVIDELTGRDDTTLLQIFYDLGLAGTMRAAEPGLDPMTFVTRALIRTGTELVRTLLDGPIETAAHYAEIIPIRAPA